MSSIERNVLNNYLTDFMKPSQIKDFCPNGLQVEGKNEIKKIVTGVTASQALIDEAVQLNADAVFVHHGFFWKGENECITGMKKNRIHALLANNISLFAYHLPLDIHPIVGNNVQLAQLLDIDSIMPLEIGNDKSIALQGKLIDPMSLESFSEKIGLRLNRTPLVNKAGNHIVNTVAWCTGGGQSYIDLAAEQGIDCFITGEASEQTIHSSNEQDIHFIAAGHHATERYGAQALGEHLAEKFGLDVSFVDINNPV